MKKVILTIVLVLFIVSCTGTESKEEVTTLEKGILKVGVSPPYEPMEFHDAAGNLVGLDVDIAKYIATELGIEIQFVEIDWDVFFESAENNEVDIALSAITITPDRSERVLFTIPYFNAGQTIIVLKDNEITSENVFTDTKIGVQIATTGEASLSEYENLEIVAYDDSEGKLFPVDTVTDLKSGEIDAIVLDYVAASSLEKNDDSLNIIGEPFTNEYYGLFSNKDNVELVGKVNEILREMKRTGELDRIIGEWV